MHVIDRLSVHVGIPRNINLAENNLSPRPSSEVDQMNVVSFKSTNAETWKRSVETVCCQNKC